MKKVIMTALMMLMLVTAMRPVSVYAGTMAVLITETDAVDEEASILEGINMFRDFISGFKEFISFLGEAIMCLFPFFTTEEVGLVIMFLLIFFVLLVYLFVRKVTV